LAPSNAVIPIALIITRRRIIVPVHRAQA